MKRIVSMLTAVLLTAGVITGCNKAQPNNDASSSSDTIEKGVISEVSESVNIPENILGEESPLVPSALEIDKFQIPDTEGLRFVENLRLGWNLGNTFDASDCDSYVQNELDYEHAWCGADTTMKMIAAVKGAGFRTIRIPVSWHNHVDADFHIHDAWMNRVKEVVDMCISCDLYVILNTHHDNAEAYYYPDSAHFEQSKAYLTAVWSQMADTFADYDEHLILESLNEPRLVGTNYEWWLDANSAQCQDAVQCINKLNQLFVDTVRGKGGNNATRYLLCPGYCASADGCMNDGFALPQDAENRVIVSVHAYTPYDFALNKTGTDAFDCTNPSDVRSVTSFMDDLYGKFVQNGIPVLIGEFGALNKDNLENRVGFSAIYAAAARARGITCCWWDNNAFTGDGENFGLLFRRTATFNYPEIVQALVKYAAP